MGIREILEADASDLKTVNDALAHKAPKCGLPKGSSYFYFDSGEATEWLERRVHVSSIGSLTLANGYRNSSLRQLNSDIRGRKSKTYAQCRARLPNTRLALSIWHIARVLFCTVLRTQAFCAIWQGDPFRY